MKSVLLKRMTILSVAVVTMLTLGVFTGCGDDDNGGGNGGGNDGGSGSVKLSPPSWIQGSWYMMPEMQTDEFAVRFTADDIIMFGVSLKDEWGINIAGTNINVSEKKESDLYELNISGKERGQSGSVTYSFKKGSGNTLTFTLTAKATGEQTETEKYTLYSGK